MCLIVFAWQVVPHAPLIAAANRDEFYDRPTAAADWWPDHPQIYAGRDLRDGGSWMGVTRDGPRGSRFAAITNIRSPEEKKLDAPSRGTLVADYLAGELTPQQYVAQLADRADQFNGFNLLVAERDTLIWFSNRGQQDPRNGVPLAPGIYGLSNGLLDSAWPKVVRTKAQFASLICQCASEDAYFEMLADTTRAPDVRLPDTGVDLEWERILSSVCIESPSYGTRSSTLARLHTEAPALLHERIIR